MMRLVKAGLMYGNLFEVSSEALIRRYNRALERLTGKQTALTDFHVDISGFSPEIGVELDDDLYLNPNGCNRQFILLSTKQKSAPLLNATFSTSRDILKQFIAQNEPQLFALTARDAVAGELINSVFSVAEPAKLFQIHQVVIEADTTGAHLEDATTLLKKIEQFETEPEAWWDDVLIAEMIALAETSGDVLNNPVTLKYDKFRQDDFYTSHFGGVYIFRDVKAPAAITARDPAMFDKLPIATVFGFENRNDIARFLEVNELAESITDARNLDEAALLRQRLDFILVDTASNSGEDLSGLDRLQLRRMTRRYYDQLPQEYHALNDLLRWVEDGAKWPEITSEHPAYFYTLRATQGKDRDLVNMLLAELCPMDVRQLFICHKQAFYRAYKTWSEAKQAYVVDFIVREYTIDKAGARRSLFGLEPDMSDAPAPAPVKKHDDLIRRVGPWGVVRRRS